MKIKINGVEVRIENLGEEVEVKFEQLSEEAQKRVFLDNKDKFFIDAIKSTYKSVGDLAVSKIKECSKITVNETVKKLVEAEEMNLNYMERVLQILDSSDADMFTDTLDILAFSKYWSIRNWIAWKGNVSTSTLQKMFVEAIKAEFRIEEDVKCLNHIIKNPNFQFDVKMANKLKYE